MTLQLGKLTILPESGRVLTLEPLPGGNVLWHNPLPPTPGAWCNPGGDRTWISPECDLFLPDGTWASYTVPASVDPGCHEVLEHSARRVVLRNRIAAHFFRQRADLGLTVTKCITETVPELHGADAAAGYETETRLTADGPLPPGVFPAVWSLLQLPPGGRILFRGEAPVSYFGRPDWREVGDGLCEVNVSAAGDSYKIGIPASRAHGVMAYWNTTAARPFLVVRRFAVYREGRYGDAPLGRPDQPCVQQIFSDNGSSGGFGEMEHHSEVLTPEHPEIVDRCSTMAWIGDKKILETRLEQLFQ